MISYIKKIRERIKDGTVNELVSQWKWMGYYIKCYWILISIYTLLGASGSLLGLGTSMVSKNLVDAVTGYNTQKIFEVVCVYVGVGVSQIFINIIKSRIALRIRMKISNEIRSDIFSQILKTDWEALSEYKTGDLLYRINGDAGMVANNILGFFPNMVSVFITFSGAFVVMVKNDPAMALIALAGAPITLLSTRYSTKKMREFQKENQDLASTKMSFNQETFQNLQVIKAFGLVGHFVEQYKEVQDENLQISLEQNKFQAKITILTGLIGQAIGYACYGFAVFRLWRGDISYGTMTMFVTMSGSLRSAFNSIVNLFPTVIRAGISAGRVMEITQLPREEAADEEAVQEMREESKKSGISIRMENVSFWYKGGKPIYENADLSASPGEIIGLIGPSGQGKTTTLRILLGLFHIKKGMALVESKNGTKIQISSATRCFFSYIPQNNTLFSGTIADNMRLLKPDATDDELISVLKTACAWEFVSELEEGIDTQVRESGQRFSEGQKQRICIARALLVNAPVLLLDEATSSLDMATEKSVLHNIMVKEPYKIIIVAAHRPSVFSMCSRVYKIQNKQIREVDESGIEDFLQVSM